MLDRWQEALSDCSFLPFASPLCLPVQVTVFPENRNCTYHFLKSDSYVY